MKINKPKLFNEAKSKLTDRDIEEIVEIVGHRCRQKTKDRLRSILTYSPSSISNYGIMDRLIYEDYGWHYCAGQSYTDEIRTVREIILGK